MEPANEKKKKGGRPKKSITRERTTGIRLSITEYLLVKEKARRVGLNLTTYIRQAAIEAKISSRLTAEEMEYVRQLVGFSNNIWIFQCIVYHLFQSIVYQRFSPKFTTLGGTYFGYFSAKFTSLLPFRADNTA